MVKHTILTVVLTVTGTALAILLVFTLWEMSAVKHIKHEQKALNDTDRAWLFKPSAL